jgi:hypothetical protein
VLPPGTWPPGRVAAAVLLGLLLLGCGGGGPGAAQARERPPLRQHVTGVVPPPGACHYRHASDGALLPDPACTPGATDPRVTQENLAVTVCSRGYTALVRPPVEETDRVKHGLLLAYRQTLPSELDHLIPLELGGSSDVRNLWPEPPPSPNPKDKVEEELHALVCARTWGGPGTPYLPLVDAQRLIASDWTTALARARQGLVSR